MKKATLLALALTIPASVTAADKDSVYAWGAWSQNIQPAAGPRIEVAPAAVSQPQVNFRPNENAAFNRVASLPETPAPVTPPPVTPPPAIPTDNIVTGFGDISPDAELTPPPSRTPPPPPAS
jgi:hypothetical protein